MRIRGLVKPSLYLYDEDVVGAALKGNVGGYGDGNACRKRVDTGEERLAADGAASYIFPRCIGVRARRGVGVRSLHVVDRSDQVFRSGSGVIRCKGFARDLRGRRKLCRRVQCQGKAGNGCRSDG